MRFLLDPKIFNYIIMTLYCLNSIRWGVNYFLGNGTWADCAYWLSALAITLTVTFGYRH